MTTGEKLALLRKKKGLTQEELSEQLDVSRQSVSRWEMDVSFPETEKLIKLSKIFACSIDFLHNEAVTAEEEKTEGAWTARDCYSFIRKCGYFFLATSVNGRPRLRPFGMIYEKEDVLFIATDTRKSVYYDLTENPRVEIASYHPATHKWIRIGAEAIVERSNQLREEMMDHFPNLRRSYQEEEQLYLVIYRLRLDDIEIK